MVSSSESDLITRCCGGESGAWDELFERHYAPTARFIFQLSPDFTMEDAEEICQEVFLSVIKSLPAFQQNSQLQTWIFRIAANRAKDHRDKQFAAKRGSGQRPLSLQADDPETGLTIDPPASLPPPDVLLATQEGYQLLGQALDQVGETCREIIELRYFADLSYHEISAALDLNEKTVSSRLSKCLDRLEKLALPIFAAGKNRASTV